MRDVYDRLYVYFDMRKSTYLYGKWFFYAMNYAK